MLENSKEYIGDLNGNVKCPKCGESYYAELHSITTCLSWTPIYKDGVLMNRDPNTTTTLCECMNCGHHFSIER